MAETKSIRGWADYSVRDDGVVFSGKRGQWSVLRPHTVNRGDRRKSYLRVTLYKNGKKKNLRVHRLVALAFIKKPRGRSTVNHINGNTRDNRVKNLEWASGAENTKHAWKNGLMQNSVGARWKKRRPK